MLYKPYFLINAILACAIIAIFVYAGFFAFSGNGVSCSYKKITGLNCITCGVTRGFNKILHGNITEALAYNQNALKLFCFFAIVLYMRIVAMLTKNPTLNFIRFDIVVTTILFLYCFKPIIFGLFA